MRGRDERWICKLCAVEGRLRLKSRCREQQLSANSSGRPARLRAERVGAMLGGSSGSSTSEPSVRGVTLRLTSTEHEERGPRVKPFATSLFSRGACGN
jgi:hypothetical protein